jgi:hypothetical protein
MRDLPLRFSLRKLFAAHVRRTRNYLYALATGRPERDLNDLRQRLLRHQDEIANALRPQIGEAAGNRLATLLREHAGIAVELFAALKAGDKTAAGRANSRWYNNATEIASFFAALKPKWPRNVGAAILHKQLKLTTDEAGAMNAKDWMAFSEAYRRAFNHTIRFADFISAGLEK